MNLDEIEARAQAAAEFDRTIQGLNGPGRTHTASMSGALAADVQVLLAEVRRLRGELAAAEYIDAEGDAWGPGIMAQE